MFELLFYETPVRVGVCVCVSPELHTKVLFIAAAVGRVKSTKSTQNAPQAECAWRHQWEANNLQMILIKLLKNAQFVKAQ